MVKAYLRYVQERVFSGLSSSQSNVKIIKVSTSEHGTQVYIVSAANEVVNLTNSRTGHVDFQVYDREAMHGTVTCVAVTGSLLAIGYTSGTVLVYNLEVVLTE